MWKRTVISAKLLVDGTCLENTGKVFVGHADAGVGLPVFQQHVIARVVFLDERVFEQQGIFFGLHHRVGNIVYLAHKNFCFETVHLLMEVGRHPALELLGFAHVDDLVLAVVKLVAAGKLRQVQHDVFQIGETLFVFFLCHVFDSLLFIDDAKIFVSRETGSCPHVQPLLICQTVCSVGWFSARIDLKMGVRPA